MLNELYRELPELTEGFMKEAWDLAEFGESDENRRAIALWTTFEHKEGKV